MPELPLIEVMEPLSNEITLHDTPEIGLVITNNNKNETIPDICISQDDKLCNNNKENPPYNSGNNANMEYLNNSALEVISVEIMDCPESPNENNKTQSNTSHIMDERVINVTDQTDTGIADSPKSHIDTNNTQDSINSTLDKRVSDQIVSEVTIPPNDNEKNPAGNSDDHSSMIKDTVVKASSDEDVKSSANVKGDPQGVSDNSSNMKLEHIMSLKVVLKRAKYIGCPNCNLVFFRPKDLKLHSIKHLLPSKKDSDDSAGRFVKRFTCDVCEAKFVLKSTLEAHAPLHAPLPHRCRCGVGFYRADDLVAHRNLVHIAEIRDEYLNTGLTDRQQKAFKHEIWQPNIAYSLKKEPKQASETKKKNIAYSLKKEPKSETKKKRQIRSTVTRPESYTCEEEKLIVKNEDRTFSCPICFKRLKSKEGTVIHLRTHSGVRPYRCDVCGKRFSQSAGLYTHQKIHNGVKEFKCTVCGKEFVSKSNMWNHVRTHTGEKPFKCSFCPKSFSDQSAHRRHERTHTGVKPYACKFCGMRFSDASGLIAHERRHDGSKQHQCTECHKLFWTKHDLRKHTETVHGYEKNYSCEICNKPFALKSYLYVHMQSHGNIKRFECDYCGFRSRMKSNLMKHIQTIHLRVKALKCSECGLKIFCANKLRAHRTNVHIRPLNYECDVCGRKESLKSLLFKHIIAKHSAVKCELCTRRFANSADLRKHAEKGCHKCHCGRYFTTPSSLESHKLVHDSSQPYLCSFCDKRFKTMYMLKKHYLSVHENSEKYECDDCGIKLSNRQQITNHIHQTHSTVRVYCHICKKSFFSEYELKRHKAKKLCNNNQYKCGSCGKVFHSNSKLLRHLQFHDVPKFHCDHCSRKFKTKPLVRRHINLCHKHILRIKRHHTK